MVGVSGGSLPHGRAGVARGRHPHRKWADGWAAGRSCSSLKGKHRITGRPAHLGLGCGPNVQGSVTHEPQRWEQPCVCTGKNKHAHDGVCTRNEHLPGKERSADPPGRAEPRARAGRGHMSRSLCVTPATGRASGEVAASRGGADTGPRPRHPPRCPREAGGPHSSPPISPSHSGGCAWPERPTSLHCECERAQ